MLCLSIQNNSTDDRVFYKCPKCFEQDVYFVTVPDKCNHCGYSFPNMEKIRKDRIVRYNYHIFAEY